MADAKRCDRCGNYYQRNGDFNVDDSWWRYTIVKDNWPNSGEVKLDLCTDCRKKLFNWIEKGD